MEYLPPFIVARESDDVVDIRRTAGAAGAAQPGFETGSGPGDTPAGPRSPAEIHGDDLRVMQGTSPSRIDEPARIGHSPGTDRIRIVGLEPGRRYYFRILTAKAPPAIVAERRVELQGALNFRDLGGYRASGGRCIRWGLVFRSDNLARLTDRDIDRLTAMGLRTVCDFRTREETGKAPDRFPVNKTRGYVHAPIDHLTHNAVSGMERLMQGDTDWLTPEYIITGYLRNIDDFAHAWKPVLEHLALADSRPLVFHCTGGKDRAGTFAALLLALLGVPEDGIIHDYCLTNDMIAGLLDRLRRRVERMGLDYRRFEPYFLAEREVLRTVLRHIRSTYGGVEPYLGRHAGVSAATLASVREALLE